MDMRNGSNDKPSVAMDRIALASFRNFPMSKIFIICTFCFFCGIA